MTAKTSPSPTKSERRKRRNASKTEAIFEPVIVVLIIPRIITRLIVWLSTLTVKPYCVFEQKISSLSIHGRGTENRNSKKRRERENVHHGARKKKRNLCKTTKGLSKRDTRKKDPGTRRRQNLWSYLLRSFAYVSFRTICISFATLFLRNFLSTAIKIFLPQSKPSDTSPRRRVMIALARRLEIHRRGGSGRSRNVISARFGALFASAVRCLID